jgi:hypothetical protein
MRDLFEERGTDSTEILNQVQDDEPSVGIFRDDKVALASTLNSHYSSTNENRLQHPVARGSPGAEPSMHDGGQRSKQRKTLKRALT